MGPMLDVDVHAAFGPQAWVHAERRAAPAEEARQ